MVRRDSVMRLLATGAFLLMLIGGPRPAVAHEELVLIVSATSSVEQLDSSLVRRLFLGLTVAQNGIRLRPVLNESDNRIKELFFQNIVSMTDGTYDRYVLRQSLLQGRTQPAVYKDNAALMSAVAADPSVVGYTWARDAVRDRRVRVLRIVWHD